MTNKDFEANHNLQGLIFFTLAVTAVLFPFVLLGFYFIGDYFVLLKISAGFAVIITVIRIFVKKINVGTHLYGLLIPIIFFYVGRYIYIYHDAYQRIQHQASYVANNQLNMHVKVQRKVNYDVDKYDIVIKNTISINDLEMDDKYVFQLSTDDKKQLYEIIGSIKKINNYVTTQTPSCGMIISIETNSNFLTFENNVLGIGIEGENNQKAINDLLNFITLKTNSLVDFNASCPN